MNNIFAIIIMTLLWVVNIFNGTGLNEVYHVTDIAKYTVIVLAAATMLLSLGNKNKRQVEKKSIFVFTGVILVFFISAAARGYASECLGYIWVYMLIYLIGQLSISSKAFYIIGLIYGFLGAFVLVIYDYGSVLSGWNENAIAMIGMHSYLIFIIPFFKDSRTYTNKIIIIAATALFAFLLAPTQSRSGTLFLIIEAAFAMKLIKPKVLVRGSKKRFLVLLVPFIIAAVVSIISGTPMTEKLNTWSMDQFDKPIFNGRDELWLEGFRILKENFLLGTGNLSMENWHNSAIACLTAFGVVGFILWIMSFKTIIDESKTCFFDPFVAGSVISFMVLYMQQSVELGFITSSPSMLPYVLLGMMLARVNHLKKRESNERRLNNHEA